MADRRIEIIQLQESLKEIMHARRLRLSDLAKHLDLSIATAKRLLNGDDLSMERVLAICDWMDLQFHDLVEIAKQRKATYHYCSEEQEQFLADHQPHFAFLRALQRGDSTDVIMAKFGLNEQDVGAYLADLEAQGFLKYSSSNQVQLTIKDGMDWRPNGPLWQSYYKRWIRETTTHMESQSTDQLDVTVEISQRKFTQKTIQNLRQEMDQLSRKYAAISRLERQVHRAEDLKFYTLAILGDTWTAPLFNVPPYARPGRKI